MSDAKGNRSIPETVKANHDESVTLFPEVCASCGALVDPDAVVLHRRFHDDLVPTRRIEDVELSDEQLRRYKRYEP